MRTAANWCKPFVTDRKGGVSDGDGGYGDGGGTAAWGGGRGGSRHPLPSSVDPQPRASEEHIYIIIFWDKMLLYLEPN